MTNSMDNIQPDINDVINDLSMQVANLTKDGAIQRALIRKLQEELAKKDIPNK